jgi:DNA invertase Pin-like site-specific DNA recombinase
MAKPNGYSSGTATAIPALSCAIYTRKSSEEGLEQDFNSLHAQREACEAFVLSQKGLGWTPIPTAYDDGGFSGGNVERPALRRLIQDIEAGKVKVIVVYKVDRLTRSLSDFAKLVDLFDAQGVSFVSVTQQFNTTTSMGRLTLNVLLSFAQFEREVTGERIRDKIAASKRKGLWMGGIVPIGYRAKGRTLEPDEEQAPRVREIYQLYLKLSGVSELDEVLQSRGWLTPERAHKRAGFGGNKPFSRGHLYRILSNPVYIGLMAHKGDTHPGQHPPLIEQPLWDAVQAKLEAQRSGHKSQSHAANPSLLSGKLFDEAGRRLIPSHARKGNKRYRYYVTSADAPGDALRLPANEIEQLVIKAVMDWASDAKQVVDAVGWGNAKAAEEAIAVGQKVAQALAKSDQEQNAREHLGRYIETVEVGPSAVRITVDLVGCAMAKAGTGAETAQIEVAAERKRCGMAVRLIVGGPNANRAPEPDQTLIQLINKARDWLDRLTRLGQGIGDIAKEENVSPGYVTRLLHLALLAPDITQSIAAGEHPVDVTATRLMQALPLPSDWSEQRKVLGMG